MQITVKQLKSLIREMVREYQSKYLINEQLLAPNVKIIYLQINNLPSREAAGSVLSLVRTGLLQQQESAVGEYLHSVTSEPASATMVPSTPATASASAADQRFAGGELRAQTRGLPPATTPATATATASAGRFTRERIYSLINSWFSGANIRWGGSGDDPAGVVVVELRGGQSFSTTWYENFRRRTENLLKQRISPGISVRLTFAET